jgi:hypothetical protein
METNTICMAPALNLKPTMKDGKIIFENTSKFPYQNPSRLNNIMKSLRVFKCENILDSLRRTYENILPSNMLKILKPMIGSNRPKKIVIMPKRIDPKAIVIEPKSVEKSKVVPDRTPVQTLANNLVTVAQKVQSTAISPTINSSQNKDFIPQGYEIKNVPSDGCCGIWSIVVDKKAAEQEDGTPIQVTKKEVFDLLRILSDQIAYTLKKEHKTSHEIELIEEIDQLIRDNYAKNYEDLYRKIESGGMQLDSPLACFLAPVIGYDIIIETDYNQNKMIHTTEVYASGNATAKKLRIYYNGNGGNGHYQAIIKKGHHVQYNT